MRAGELKHRVTLQTPTTVTDTNGDAITTWAEVATFRAAIDTLSVREQFMAAQDHASATHRVRTHYLPALAAADGKERLVFDGRYFPLVGRATDVDMQHREVHFLVEEGLKDG